MKQVGVTIFFLFLFASPSFLQPLNKTIRGVITNEDNKPPIAGATVDVEGSNPVKTLLTNAEGSFRFDDMPIGLFTLLLSFIGYEKIILPNVVVNSGKEVVVNINMQQAVTQLNNILIAVDKNKGQALNDKSIVRGRFISPEQTNRYASGVGDPSRILSNFAGVTSTGDGSNNIIVKGNSPKYIQWRLEGVQVADPNHFSDQKSACGSISALNDNLLAISDFKTVALLTEYCNVLCGVYDVKLLQGNNVKFKSTFEVRILGTELFRRQSCVFPDLMYRVYF